MWYPGLAFVRVLAKAVVVNLHMITKQGIELSTSTPLLLYDDVGDPMSANKAARIGEE